MLLHRVITALALLLVIGGTLFFAPTWVWGILSLALLAAAGWEWGQLIAGQQGMLSPVGARDERDAEQDAPPRKSAASRTIVFAIAAVGVAYLGWRELKGGTVGGWLAVAVAVVLLTWLVIAVPAVLAARLDAGRPAFAIVAMLALWVALLELRLADPILVLSSMAIVWCADIGAYFVGRAFGRRKLAPRVSPGKSWEGAWGGLAATVAVALGAAWLGAWLGASSPILSSRLAERAGVAGMVLALTVLVALSILGDLYESLLKRSAGVKDSGRLLPGHGGVLDRIDALIPAMPLCLLIWMTISG